MIWVIKGNTRSVDYCFHELFTVDGSMLGLLGLGFKVWGFLFVGARGGWVRGI